MHCASCGAPSVLGASRCPKCLAPFGAVGPMSGMILAEEEPARARPNLRWLGTAIAGVVAMLGIGLWAVLRGRGTPSPAPVSVAPTPTPVAVAPTPAPAAEPTPAKAPVPASTPEPARGDTLFRATTWVWLRADPVNTAEQLGVVNPKQVVRILERRFAWVRVRVDGKEGWMSADYVERIPE